MSERRESESDTAVNTSAEYACTDWTCSEAAKTKAFIAQQNYIRDQFIAHFCPRVMKRTPEIARGYYCRHVAMNHVISQLSTKQTQIVNIGSGFDTLFWRLKSQNIEFKCLVDIDMNQVVIDKIRLIRKSKQLFELLDQPISEHINELHSMSYHIVECDATKFKRLIADTLLGKCSLQSTQPILVLFECVLLYWTQQETNQLLYALNKTFKQLSIVVFDCVNMNDNFARVMQQSLCERDTPLLGARECQTLEDWNRRLTENGMLEVLCHTMTQIYNQLIPRNEIRRIEKIEFLDELELLEQLLQHYCLIIANNYSKENSIEIDWNQIKY